MTFKPETADLLDRFREMSTYGGSAPYQAQSETSQSAAASMEGHLPHLQAVVFDFLDKCPYAGATQDEISDALDLGPQTTCPRLRELEMKGLIVKTSAKRETRSGRLAFVYVTGRYK